MLPGLGACSGNRSAWGGLGRLHTGAFRVSQLEAFLSTERAGLLEAFLYGRCNAATPPRVGFTSVTFPESSSSFILPVRNWEVGVSGCLMLPQ